MKTGLTGIDRINRIRKGSFTMKDMKLGTKENMFNHERHEKARKKSVSELWRVYPQ